MHEKNTTRESRMLTFVPPMRLDLYREDEGMWHESREDKEETLRRYRVREKRMAWVEAAMHLHLSPKQRESVRLHYLSELTFRQIGALLGVHHATAHRHCCAGIKTLRELAEKRNGGMQGGLAFSCRENTEEFCTNCAQGNAD